MKTKNILFVAVFTFFQGVLAQSGTPDISFGNNGAVINSVGIKDEVRKIKVQKDRKILVLGSIKDSDLHDIVLTRHLPDGEPDTDFGDNGTVKTKLSITDLVTFNKIFFQLDQKILITGETSSREGIIVRYHLDGTLDTSFGGHNNGTLLLSTPNAVNDIIVQPDGKFLVANITDRSFAITRFNADGTLDLTYGDDGTASTFETQSRQSDNYFSEILLTANNDLILAATHLGGGLGASYLFYEILVFDTNGTIVSGFFEYSDGDFVFDVALDNNSNIYVSTTKGFVFKLDENLDLNETFGENGFLQKMSSDRLKVNVDNENNIIFSNTDLTTGASYLKKYTTNGVLDTSFGVDGTIFISENQIIRNLEIQKNDKILVGGTTLTSSVDAEGTDSILLRYNGDSIEEEESPITCFSLINAKTNIPVLFLEDGKSYPINNIVMSSLNIEASIASNLEFKSYVLNLEGPLNISRTENVAPYAIFGDLAGDFFGKTLPEGSYTIVATPFAEPNAKGESGVPLKVSFELVNAPSVIESFTLIETNTGNLVAEIKEGDELKLDQDLSYSIIANTSPKTQGSVAMELSGPLMNSGRIENQVPYAIFGDINGKIFGNRFPQRGEYTISATPFSKGYGTGIAGEKLTVEFSVSFYFKTSVYVDPIFLNEGLGIIDVSIGERFPDEQEIFYSVYNPFGIKIGEGSFFRSVKNMVNDYLYRFTIPTDKLIDNGVYILKIGPDTVKFMTR